MSIENIYVLFVWVWEGGVLVLNLSTFDLVYMFVYQTCVYL